MIHWKNWARNFVRFKYFYYQFHKFIKMSKLSFAPYDPKRKVPFFNGKNDPGAYLSWERKLEILSERNHFSEWEKVQVATNSFIHYDNYWWDK